jgi:hypothetical protein
VSPESGKKTVAPLFTRAACARDRGLLDAQARLDRRVGAPATAGEASSFLLADGKRREREQQGTPNVGCLREREGVSRKTKSHALCWSSYGERRGKCAVRGEARGPPRFASPLVGGGAGQQRAHAASRSGPPPPSFLARAPTFSALLSRRAPCAGVVPSNHASTSQYYSERPCFACFPHRIRHIARSDGTAKSTLPGEIKRTTPPSARCLR